ncbi:CHAT domain-containing protein [Streptomyces sp. NPDC050658]|uniref:CHAT domain-containing protein n=1 Tax=unclassified Streptomyces TaxID=2593676 RepID=UPI00341BA2EB
MRAEDAARRILQEAGRADAGPGALEWFLAPESEAAAGAVREGLALPDGSVWALGVLALGHLDWCRYLAGGGADRAVLGSAVLWFALIHEQDPGQVPPGLRPLFATVSGGPDGAATEPGFAYDAAVGVTVGFQQRRFPGALPIAEALLRHAAAAVGDGSLHQGMCLSDLGLVLLYAFQDGAGLDVLSEAVDCGRAAVACAPGDRDEQARRHSNLGYTLRHWAEASAHRELLREAVAELRGAVDLCTEGNPLRAQHVATLGSALCTAAKSLGDPARLPEAIGLLRSALTEPDAVLAHRASFLSDLGIALITWAVQGDDRAESYDEGIAACRRAAEIATNAVERTVYLTNLALMLGERAQRTGAPRALEEACAAARDALDGAPPGHPMLAQAHFGLAGVLGARHAATGSVADLDEAVDHARRAVHAVPTEDLGRRVRHGIELADLLRRRAVARQATAVPGEVPDELHEAVTLLRGLDQEVPARSAERARILLALGRCLEVRAAAGSDADADDAVDCFLKCLVLPPPGSDFEADVRFDLGAALTRRATDDEAWRQGAVELRRGLDLLPPDSPQRWERQAEYAVALAHRGEATSDAGPYEEAVRLLRESVTHVPDAYASQGSLYRSNLGTVLAKLAMRTGDVALFAEAEAAHREAVAMAPEQDHRRVERLGGLGETLLARAEFSSEPALLKEAVEVLRAALDRSDGAAPGRAGCLVSLGEALRTLARFTGDPATLEEAVSRHREAVAVSTGPDASVALLSLANSLADSYRHSREAGLNDEAVRHFRAALALVRPGSDERGMVLTGLGYCEWYRAVDSGDEALMDSAVGTLREAVTQVPGARIGMALTNLGGALMDRARATGNRVWLTEAVTVLRRALRESPPTAMERSLHLNNLAEALRRWYETVGDVAAVDEAAGLLRAAVDAEHGEQLGAELAAINLGVVLNSRARIDADAGAAAEARQVLEAVADRLGERHPQRPFALLHLADACVITAQLARDTDAALARRSLHQAVAAVREPLAGTPKTHPNHGIAQGLLAQTQLSLAALGERADLAEAVRLARDCAHNPVVPGVVRLLAARSWGEAAARAGDRPDALDGFAYAVALLPSIAPRDLARADQEARLRISTGLAGDAAALALDAGSAGRALALLEQGRGVLLAQGLENRADVSRLHDLDAGRAAEFERIRDQLSTPPRDDHEAGVTAEARQTLARRWDRLLAEIRELPGLAGFLRPPSVAELSTAAAEGPVVVVNVSGYRCDALIVTADAGIDVVPLPGLTPAAARSRAAEFIDGIDEAYGGKGTDSAVAAMRALSTTLGWLWDTVAAPVLERLGLDAVPGDGEAWPRLWWCATGWLSFLPLHAAGRGAPDSGTWVLDRAVSSYTPTVRALVRARAGLAPAASARPSPLVVALAETPGAAPLPGASREAALLAELFPEGRLLSGADATVDAVGRALDGHPWAHFSCHGVSDLLSPSQSGLVLHDGRFTVFDAAAQRPRDPRLAVLSACSTSRGGVDLPDEAVQLTAAFQLAGYPQVIGTLWPVADELATRLTEELYAALADDVAHGRPIDPAAALHGPVRALRDRYARAPHLWAAHVHTGP